LIIKAVNLGKRFGRLWALKNISFEIEGGIVAILGPNGSGKTTLLMILAGLRYPSTGRAYVNGVEPYSEREKALGMISFMFEKPRFNLSIKVRDIVGIVLEERGCGDEAEELALKLGLNEFYNTALSDLSSGQAQLVGIWVSLACWDGVVIFDEPFAHLDLNRVRVLAEIMRSRKNVIFTTHTIEEAEALADHIIALNKGTVAWSGNRESLFSSSTFEVYPRVDKEKVVSALANHGCSEVVDVGLSIIVKDCDEETLTRVLKEGVISGFKRAGLRAVLVEG